jgi:mannose-6-phosphate isomerase-like protein (cupin superfamily)
MTTAPPAPFSPARAELASKGEMVLVQTFMGPHPAPNPTADGLAEPQAFHVEMGEACSLDVHFHELEQFQVMVSGAGRLGRHEVQAGAVHYTDAHTPYGPIVAGPPGLGYLTLRRESDTRTLYMPASRDRLGEARAEQPSSAHRNIEFDPRTCPNEALCWHLDELDGLRIGHLRVRPGARAVVERPIPHDTYLVITEGTAFTEAAGEREWLPLVSYLPAASAPLTLIAGEYDVTALVLIFGSQRIS